MPLRLKSLELQGYKTFASKTTFEFAGGITAIVGPNGSGKSNIADALRWVLGEQSYALLRGKKTEDMIFNGSEHRARAGMASAHILFDNAENWLPVDFTEVGMTRRAYRDGHNDYLLNGQQVRLRDLNELLAASGLSERTYTILGQGLVDASLALKADERRRLFEEAAGVGLYRVRREDALKRLENTSRNLERVLDIMSELEPRLRSLERQAKRAIEYARAQADLKVILREWYGYHWHRAQQELITAREAVGLQEVRVNEARMAHQKSQAGYNSFRDRFAGLRSQLNAWHRESAELHRLREEVSRELAVLEERHRSLLARQTSILAEQERAMDEEKDQRERIENVEQELHRLQGEYEEASSQLKDAELKLQSGQSDRAVLEEKLLSTRAQIDGWTTQRVESQARLDELTSRLETFHARLAVAEKDIDLLETKSRAAGEKYASARARREETENVLRQAVENEERGVKEMESREADRRAKQEERADLLSAYTRLRTQLEVIEQAEQSLAGYAEGARFLLDAARQFRLKQTRGALSAVLDVPAEFEVAITAALGDALDAILLDEDEIEDALRLLEADGAGRAALLPLENGKREALAALTDESYMGIASELVSVDDDLRPAVRMLLGHTLVARDRTGARRIIQTLPAHARVVTLRGEVFRGDGLIIAGKAASSSALSRPRQKRELTESFTALDANINALNGEVETISNEITQARSALNGIEQEVRELRLKVEAAQEVESQAGLESEAVRRQLEWQRSQRDQLKADLQQAESDRSGLMQAVAEVQSRLSDSRESVRVFTLQLGEADMTEVHNQATYWNTRLAVSERALSDAGIRMEERRKELDRFESRRFELESRIKEFESAVDDLDRSRRALHEREGGLQLQIEELHVKIEPAEVELASAEQEEMQLQDGEANAQRSLATSERLLGQVQLELMRKQESLDNLRQKITDDFGLVMFEYAADVAGPVPLPFEGMVEELPVITDISPDLEVQLTQNRARMRRMGPINPEAKQEFDSESERYSFMRTQVDDLRKAESDLRQVIAELDELTKQSFSKTFDAVDKQFRAMFTRLFGGGSARLALTDPDNLVETGIEIEARLPGRREQGLALLSGGERSLTAVALVFALLKVSPTPVCVMDEVDAMLDEANVGRFRDLLQELSRDTQFIVITHNRNTVQAADVIYGITMGRDSASQIISLRLDQVTDEMLKRG